MTYFTTFQALHDFKKFKKEFVSPTRDQIHHVFLSPLNIKRVDAQITTPNPMIPQTYQIPKAPLIVSAPGVTDNNTMWQKLAKVFGISYACQDPSYPSSLARAFSRSGRNYLEICDAVQADIEPRPLLILDKQLIQQIIQNEQNATSNDPTSNVDPTKPQQPNPFLNQHLGNGNQLMHGMHPHVMQQQIINEQLKPTTVNYSDQLSTKMIQLYEQSIQSPELLQQHQKPKNLIYTCIHCNYKSVIEKYMNLNDALYHNCTEGNIAYNLEQLHLQSIRKRPVKTTMTLISNYKSIDDCRISVTFVVTAKRWHRDVPGTFTLSDRKIMNTWINEWRVRRTNPTYRIVEDYRQIYSRRRRKKQIVSIDRVEAFEWLEQTRKDIQLLLFHQNLAATQWILQRDINGNILNPSSSISMASVPDQLQQHQQPQQSKQVKRKRNDNSGKNMILNTIDLKPFYKMLDDYIEGNDALPISPTSTSLQPNTKRARTIPSVDTTSYSNSQPNNTNGSRKRTFSSTQSSTSLPGSLLIDFVNCIPEIDGRDIDAKYVYDLEGNRIKPPVSIRRQGPNVDSTDPKKSRSKQLTELELLNFGHMNSKASKDAKKDIGRRGEAADRSIAEDQCFDRGGKKNTNYDDYDDFDNYNNNKNTTTTIIVNYDNTINSRTTSSKNNTSSSSSSSCSRNRSTSIHDFRTGDNVKSKSSGFFNPAPIKLNTNNNYNNTDNNDDDDDNKKIPRKDDGLGY